MNSIPPDTLVNVPASHYDAWVGWRSTQLKIAHERSIAHAQLPSKDTGTFTFGRALHTLTLEGEDAFACEYVIEPEWRHDGRTREGHLERIEWHVSAQVGARQPISHKVGQAVSRLRDCVLGHPWAREHILEARRLGHVEQSIWWRDGVEQKARLDAHLGGMVIDLKGLQDCSKRGMLRAVRRYLYHLSAAHYCAGVWPVLGQVKFYLLGVEKDAVSSAQVGVWELGEGWLEKGEELRRSVLERIQAATDARWRGETPDIGYPTEPRELPGPWR